jgi:DNA repair protein RecO (recombination protein O)
VSARKSKNTGSLYYINQVEVLNSYRSVKQHELKLASASYITNIIADMLDISQPDSTSYYLLSGYLDALNLLEGDNNINFLHSVILIRIIEHHGIGEKPELCGSCSAYLTEKYYLNKDRGLFLCKNCKTSNSVLLSQNFHMLWCRLLNFNLSEDEFFDLPKSFIRDLEFYFKILIGKEISGSRYLKMIRGY